MGYWYVEDFFCVQIGANIKMKNKCILSNEMLGEMKIFNEMLLVFFLIYHNLSTFYAYEKSN